MQDFRVEAEVSKDGSVTIKGLPFQPGNRVEVIIRSRGPDAATKNSYSLRGTPVQYIDPFTSVAEGDWETLG